MRVLRPGTASNTMSPPLPPSPPSGPPNSMNFSRRKLTAPGPPAPERTKILAWSRKCIARELGDAGGEGKFGRDAGRAIEPADLADERVDEGLIHFAAGDEHPEIDRARCDGEEFLAVDIGAKLSPFNGGIEHRRELRHPPIEIG